MILNKKRQGDNKTTDLRREQRRQSIRRVLGQSLLTLFLVIALSMAWIFRFEIAAQGIGITLVDSADRFFGGETRYPVEIINPPKAMVPVGQRVAVLSERSLAIYNSMGRQVLSKALDAKQNTLMSSGNRLLMFEQGGYELEILTGTTSTYKTRTQFPIYTATLAKNGLFAFSAAAVGYQSQVEVVDLQGRTLLEWVSSEGLVLALDLDDTQGMCLIGSISSNNGLMRSTVSCYKLAGGAECWNTEIEGEMLLAVHLVPGGKATVVTDRSAVFLNENGAITASIPFDTMPIRAFAVDESGNIALALGNYALTHSMDLLFADLHGTVQARKTIDYTITGLELHQEEVLAMSPGWLTRYDRELSMVRTISSPGTTRFAPVNDMVYTAGERHINMVELTVQ
jgi:hypothetical protein